MTINNVALEEKLKEKQAKEPLEFENLMFKKVQMKLEKPEMNVIARTSDFTRGDAPIGTRQPMMFIAELQGQRSSEDAHQVEVREDMKPVLKRDKNKAEMTGSTSTTKENQRKQGGSERAAMR
ncbi:unnamed protein product [Cochlearia groenlandica]